MLVLTRHVHQSIVIGHDVVVTVLEVRGDQVRLGITAPKDIQVHREEVFAALTAANREAATSSAELEVLQHLSAGSRAGAAGGGAAASPSGAEARSGGRQEPAASSGGLGQRGEPGRGDALGQTSGPRAGGPQPPRPRSAEPDQARSPR